MSAHETKFASFFTTKKRSEWSDPNKWRQLCPSLTITTNDADNADKKEKADQTSSSSTSLLCKDTSKQMRNCLIEDGYALLNNQCRSTDNNNGQNNGKQQEQQPNEKLVQTLAFSITKLHKDHNIPATFIILYDETWTLAHYGSQVLSSCAHPKNTFNYDILAWYVDPRENMVGFSPHRDRQPDQDDKGCKVGEKDSVKQSFHKDGQAKYVTMWMALTDATPENSCLYVIPKQFDPGYTAGDYNVDDNDDGDDDEKSDPLSRALTHKESYQNIRALPRPTGQSVLFTHRILHWGSKGNAKSSLNDETPPRIAISFVSSDPSFEKPYLSSSSSSSSHSKTTTTTTAAASSSSSLTTKGNGKHQKQENNHHLSFPPPFHIRLLLVCAQLLIYHQRFNLSRDCVRACYDYCKEYANDYLDETYKRKVFVEFVKAMKEWDEKDREGGEENAKTNKEEVQNEQAKSANKEKDKSSTKPLALTAVIKKKMSKLNGGKFEIIAEENQGKSDDEDAMLEEMLDAEEGGYGDFHDDYDDLDDDNDDDDDSGRQQCEKDKRELKSDCNDDKDDEEDEDEKSVELPFCKEKGKSDKDDSKNQSDDDDDDDDEDAMLEEMLDAERKGYGNFRDDYDDLNDYNNVESDQKCKRSKDEQYPESGNEESAELTFSKEKGKSNKDDDKDESDDEDAVLEEMLDAERKGYGDFHDDYDDMDNNDNSNDNYNGKQDNDNEDDSDDDEKSIELPFRTEKGKSDKDDDKDESDDEDAMLEEMLDAERGGYGDFHDDYDELKDDEGSHENCGSGKDDKDDCGGELLFRKRKKGDNDNDESTTNEDEGCTGVQRKKKKL